MPLIGFFLDVAKDFVIPRRSYLSWSLSFGSVLGLHLRFHWCDLLSIGSRLWGRFCQQRGSYLVSKVGWFAFGAAGLLWWDFVVGLKACLLGSTDLPSLWAPLCFWCWVPPRTYLSAPRRPFSHDSGRSVIFWRGAWSSSSLELISCLWRYWGHSSVFFYDGQLSDPLSAYLSLPCL